MPLFRRAKSLLLAAALAVQAGAAVVVAPSATVYSAPGGAWSGPLGAAFGDPAISSLLPPGLKTPDAASPGLMRQSAPLVHQLEGALKITPAAFAAMPAHQKTAAVELAVDAAREELREKIYMEAENARQLASPGRVLDKHARAELYGAVGRLMEMREHYRGWFGAPEDAEPAPEIQALDDAYALAAATAWKARTSLLDPEALNSDGAEKTVAAKTPAAAPFVLKPTGNAVKLRADMENNKSGWGQSDLHALYTGCGFVLRQGGKHRFYSHPVFPQLHDSVSRQNDLPPGYASSALKLIAELERLAAPPAGSAGSGAAAAFPATLSLADLSVLLSPPAPKPAPEPAAKAVAEKTRPRAPPKERANLVETPVPPSAQVTLERPTEREPAVKPETPAPREYSPVKPLGMMDRIRVAWGKLRKSRPD